MVAEALSIQIATDQPAPGGTKNVEAYDHYLQGKSLYHLARDEESDRQALAHYDLAIAADPKFRHGPCRPVARAGVDCRRIWQGRRIEAALCGVDGAARRAVELAPKPGGRPTCARLRALFRAARRQRARGHAYERPIQLGRGNADIVLLYALYCSRAGLPEEAHAAIERALVLDPINARVHRAAGSIDYAARRYARCTAAAAPRAGA